MKALKISTRVLAGASVSFGRKAVFELVAYWAGLANQHGESVDVPVDLNRQSILDWAEQVLCASKDAEGNFAPKASVCFVEAEGAIHLRWDGYWTQGRFVEVTIPLTANGRVHHNIGLWWSTGTGKPSRFLGIEKLLVGRYCKEYWPNATAS